jgi:peptidoglycan/LPS O-acetylase OafA/YrhL
MSPSRSLQPEIQGLRALAVGLVVIFHIWPAWLPGGYVGVDVFFVISGYLITGLLARAALRDGRISPLDFYSRRARRLLPVATLVLGVTLLGTLLLLPESRWEETVIQITASAFYVQNWILAWLSVDYLGAEQVASPVQHYWSLSIEEQFYFVWPLIMMGCLALAKRGLPVRRIFAGALLAIFLLSLGASFIVTAREPESAYFFTHTRAWELALGGLLALCIHRVHIGQQWQRVALLVGGIGAVVWSAASYTLETAFPGLAALVPTVGTVAIILAGDVRLGAFRGLNARWLSYIGDRSYSIYLWHWPLIVFYTAQWDAITTVPGLGLIAATVLMAHLSYEHVEQRFRHAVMPRDWRPLRYAAASLGIFLLTSIGFSYYVTVRASATTSDALYPGPAALLAGVDTPPGIEYLPDLSALKRDIPIVYTEQCHQNQASVEAISCILGSPDGEQTMAVAGDSHAAQWVPALDAIASENGWKLVTLTKSACAFSRAIVRLGGEPYPACSEWRENAIREIKNLGVDVLFVSQSRYGIDEAEMIDGLTSVWDELFAGGVRVIPIQDTPWMPFEPGDCLAEGEPEKCTAPRSKVIAKDVYYKAAAASADIDMRVADLTDGICDAETCFSVVGNLIVWRDPHHLSATYARALAPYLAALAGFEYPIGPPRAAN